MKTFMSSQANIAECSALGILAENALPAASSASCHHVPEYIRVLTIVMPEREFRQVQRQIFLAHLVVRAHDSTLQERPEGINVRSMDVAAHVLALAVFNGFVIVIPVQQPITGMLIGRNERDFVVYGFTNKAIKCSRVGVFNHLANDITLASDSADDRNFASSAATLPAFRHMLIAFFAAHVRFVNFDFAHELGKAAVSHSRPNPVAHIPSRPVVAAANLPMDLKGTNSLLALGHQVNDLEPSPQRIVSVLKNGLGDDREAIAVFTAAILVLADPVKWAGFKLIDLWAIAARALYAIRPAEIAQVFFAILFGLKSRRELGQRHRRLCCFHGVKRNTTLGRCQAQHNRLSKGGT